jgi:hypothetical protein
MSVEVQRTGVVIRAATPEEAAAIAGARRGHDVVLKPRRSYTFDEQRDAPGEDDIRVVSQAFVEFTLSGNADRWVGPEHHGVSLAARRDATLELLDLARETLDDRIDLLSDLRIAGLDVTRWQIFSAPCVIELASGLVSKLVPLRRG